MSVFSPPIGRTTSGHYGTTAVLPPRPAVESSVRAPSPEAVTAGSALGARPLPGRHHRRAPGVHREPGATRTRVALREIVAAMTGGRVWIFRPAMWQTPRA